MNDPQVAVQMASVSHWLSLPVEQAKKEMLSYMQAHDENADRFVDPTYSRLDYDLVRISGTTQEAVDLVFGELHVDDGDDQTCIHCNGSGEGQYDGTRCRWCKGTGVDQRRAGEDE